MLNQIGRFFGAIAAWLGGWTRFVLLVVVLLAVAGGVLWERQRQPEAPPGSSEVTTSIVGSIRQTAFRNPGTVAEIRAYYQQYLPSRGWHYCGTQTTPRCTNMVSAATGAGDTTDVYRQTGDEDFRGATVEVQPIATDNGQTYVTIFETSPQ